MVVVVNVVVVFRRGCAADGDDGDACVPASCGGGGDGGGCGGGGGGAVTASRFTASRLDVFTRITQQRWPSGYGSSSIAGGTGIDPCFLQSSSTSDFNIGTAVAVRSGTWYLRVSAETGWSGVSIL